MTIRRATAISAIIAVLLTAMLVIIPIGAMASVSVNCVKITASEDNSSRMQFKIKTTIRAGDVVTFYLKPHSTDGQLRLRADSGDTVFATANFNDGATSAYVGDGWYAVRTTIAKMNDDGSEVTNYSASYLGVSIYSAATTGTSVYVRDFAINGESFSNSSLKSVITYWSSPKVTVSATTASISSSSVSYTWPTITADNFYPKENYTGTLPTYDTSMYTWTINTAKGGATNLPAVNLAATGRYMNVTNVNSSLVAALTNTTFVDANNMIFYISDGFGENDIRMTEQFSGNIILNSMPYHGSSITLSFDQDTGTSNVTTDSAAGGTALATGYKTRYSYEAMDVSGNSIPQITELLRAQKGKIIGVATTGWAYDATPAVYGGAHATRGDSSNIATQMMTWAPDLFIGEGVKDYNSIYKTLKSGVLAGQDIGFFLNWSEISGNHDKVWINLTADVRYDDDFSTTNPTISQMMAYSLTWLQAKSHAKNDVGFFLMFENGMTDDAGHKNNYVQKIGETRATNEATAIALKFACENPDTIVIQTADHDTGGLQLLSGWESDVSKIRFTTSGHSKQNVGVRAIGKNASLFDGQTLINAQVGKLTGYLMGINFGSTEAIYSIDGILAGHISDVTVDDQETDPFIGTWLHVTTTAAATNIGWQFGSLAVAAHDNCTADVRVPAGATSLTILGITSSGGTETIKTLATDKFSDYNATFDCYAVHFKPEKDYAGIRFVANGSFAPGDTAEMDNLVINSAKYSFGESDLALVAADSGRTAWITSMPSTGTAGSALLLTVAEYTTTNPWIQFKIDTAVPAGSTVSFDFKPAGSNASKYSAISVRTADAATKLIDVKGTATASVNSASSATISNVSITAAENGFYRVSFKTSAELAGIFWRFVVNDEGLTAAELVSSSASVLIDNLTVGTSLKCSFNESNVTSLAANKATLKYDNGTAFVLKRSSQLYWTPTIYTWGAAATPTPAPTATPTPKPTATPTPKPTATPTPKPTATPTPKPTATPTPAPTATPTPKPTATPTPKPTATPTPKPTATPTPASANHYAILSATATNSHPWIQFVENIGVSAGETVSIKFKPIGTLTSISVRTSDANTKLVTVSQSSGGYKATVNTSSAASNASVTYDSSTGWYTLTFKCVTAQSSGLFFRFEVGTYSSGTADSAAIAIDDLKIGSKVCSFNSSNLVSSEANNATLKTDSGTQFTLKRKSQYYWKLRIV